MTMIALRNSDGSSSCHTLALELNGENHPVMDYSDYFEAQEIADRINDKGFVVLVSEYSPTLYTVGTIDSGKFDPTADFSTFDEVLNYIQ